MTVTDHSLGPASAPITLVEYGSYNCPFCHRAHAHILNESARAAKCVQFSILVIRCA